MNELLEIIPYQWAAAGLTGRLEDRQPRRECVVVCALEGEVVFSKKPKRRSVYALNHVRIQTPDDDCRAVKAVLKFNCGLWSLHCRSDEMVHKEMPGLRARVVAGSLPLSLEDYCDLCPGTELSFKAPSSWQVMLEIGGFPIAIGRLEDRSGEVVIIIEQTIENTSSQWKLSPDFCERHAKEIQQNDNSNT